MFEGAIGRLFGGMLWGLGAGLALTLVRGDSGGMRPIAKGLMKAYVAAAERVQESVAEARETLEDVRAEMRAEREHAAAPEPDGPAPAPPTPRRRRA